MHPVSLLLKEHQLIDRMIQLMKKELGKLRGQKKIDLSFLDTTIDFIGVYTDQYHHEKEEIFLKYFEFKKMSPDNRALMQEIEKEHDLCRKVVDRLRGLREQQNNGNPLALKDIIQNIEILVDFYPEHISNEEKKLFRLSGDYLQREEEVQLLNKFMEHDQEMLHKKYAVVVDEAEKKSKKI